MNRRDHHGSLRHPAASRLDFLDLFKAVASNLIVLHHLVFYGPMADHVRHLLPDLMRWLENDARIAVQVFLVIGGFLFAKSLCPQGVPRITHPLAAIGRRFLKLAPPFFVATLLATLASWVAAQWMTHDSISAPPSLAQLAAHALLLHGILGYESISAGAWYVAIDFQLYALAALMLWVAARMAQGRALAWLTPAMVLAGVGASLLYFNLDSGWDIWAPYFFGSYGLGMLAWWAAEPASPSSSRSRAILLPGLAMLVTLVALAIDFRSRIAVALVVAVALILFKRRNPSWPTRPLPVIATLGKISFSLFLIHFPVSLIVNAAFSRFAPALAPIQGVGVLLAWGGSIAAGAGFYRWVELPLSRLATPPRPARKPVSDASIGAGGAYGGNGMNR